MVEHTEQLRVHRVAGRPPKEKRQFVQLFDRMISLHQELLASPSPVVNDQEDTAAFMMKSLSGQDLLECFDDDMAPLRYARKMQVRHNGTRLTVDFRMTVAHQTALERYIAFAQDFAEEIGRDEAHAPLRAKLEDIVANAQELSVACQKFAVGAIAR